MRCRTEITLNTDKEETAETAKIAEKSLLSGLSVLRGVFCPSLVSQ